MSSTNEEYFLAWKDHGKNFSLAFSDLLQDDKLVDVQLVAEGHLISAHRLILSAMSPYFCNMFSQMPANQQAFVFLKDISKQTMEDLITFIYRGEISVKPDRLDEFMNAAQALNIKGLAEGSYSQSFDSWPSTSTYVGPSFSESVRGIQYQASQVNRTQSSNGAHNATSPSSTFRLSRQPYENQFRKRHSENATAYDELDDNSGNDSIFESENYYHSMDQKFDSQNVQWDETDDVDNENQSMASTKTISTANGSKRVKRNNDYDIVADIRLNARGGENLFYADQMFSKHGTVNGLGRQRWQCSKRSSKNPCKATLSSIYVDGVVMMKLISVEHCH